VEEASNPVVSEHADGRRKRWRGSASGQALIQ